MNDPVLNSLIDTAYQQNLTLQQAGTRILQITALRGIAVGNLFPQFQQATGDFVRRKFSEKTANVPPKIWVQEWERRVRRIVGNRFLGSIPQGDRGGRRLAGRLGR